MKPALPSVKEAAWLKEYKASGICPPGTKWLMLGLGIPAAVGFGIAAYYGGTLASGLGKIVFTVLGVAALCGGIFAWFSLALSFVAVVLFIGLGYPALLGFGLGSVIWLLARAGKCRSPVLSGWVGFLCGAIAYGVYTGTALHFGSLHETSHLTRLLPGLASTSAWMILIVVLDAIVLVGLAIGCAWNGTQDNPFCEECGKWYGKPVKVCYSLNIVNDLLGTLKAGIPQGLEPAFRRPSDPNTPSYGLLRDWIELSLRRCACGQADFKLSTKLYWQEARIEKGRHYYDKNKRIIEEKTVNWFETMIPAGLGRQLETILFSEPASTESRTA